MSPEHSFGSRTAPAVGLPLLKTAANFQPSMQFVYTYYVVLVLLYSTINCNQPETVNSYTSCTHLTGAGTVHLVGADVLFVDGWTDEGTRPATTAFVGRDERYGLLEGHRADPDLM